MVGWYASRWLSGFAAAPTRRRQMSESVVAVGLTDIEYTLAHAGFPSRFRAFFGLSQQVRNGQWVRIHMRCGRVSAGVARAYKTGTRLT